MSNRYKPSSTCGNPIEAPCLRVEMEFPSISSLEGEECSDGLTVIEDIYAILQKYDLSDYDKGCLEEHEDNLASILNEQREKICQLEQRVEELENPCNILDMDISECGLNFTCLQENDPCNPATPIITIKDLLQKLINTNC